LAELHRTERTDFCVLRGLLVATYQDAVEKAKLDDRESEVEVEGIVVPEVVMSDGNIGNETLVETVNVRVAETLVAGTSTSTTQVVSQSGATDQANTRLKHILETVCYWLRTQVNCIPQWKYETDIVELLPVVIQGCSHSLAEISARCQGTALALCQCVRPRINIGGKPSGGANAAFFTQLIDILAKSSAHPSIQVRKIVLQCGVSLLSSSWTHFTNDTRKKLKDIFAELLVDDKPEVANEACSCMCAYLMKKSGTELQSLAEIFIKNSDALVTRYEASIRMTMRWFDETRI
jgi:hypothetical protein